MSEVVTFPSPAADSVAHAIETALSARHHADVTWLGPAMLSSRWALAADALRLLSALVRSLSPRHIVELGSGASTRVMARALKQAGAVGVVSSVDHDPEFVADTTQHLELDGTADVVELQFAPLVVRPKIGVLVPVYGWSRSLFASPEPADLVLIDGPPTVLGGRLGALSQALEVSREGTLILLDDADRKREQKALTEWASGCGATVSIRMLPALDRGMAAILVGDRRKADPVSDDGEMWCLARRPK